MLSTACACAEVVMQSRAAAQNSSRHNAACHMQTRTSAPVQHPQACHHNITNTVSLSVSRLLRLQSHRSQQQWVGVPASHDDMDTAAAAAPAAVNLEQLAKNPRRSRSRRTLQRDQQQHATLEQQQHQHQHQQHQQPTQQQQTPQQQEHPIADDKDFKQQHDQQQLLLPRRQRKQTRPQQQQQQQQQQLHPGSGIPPEEVWQQELRHLLGLMVDPHKPLQRQFVLQQCYCLNSSDTQEACRQLSAQAMGKLAADRHRLEGRLSKAVHALSAAWVRLQLLNEAVLEQGAGLTEPQLAKEREGIVAIRDRLKQAQRLHARTVSKASELGDSVYLARAQGLLQLLLAASAAAESYLAPGMSNIAAASKVNTVFRNAWAKTPQAQRPAPSTAEAQRCAQLSQLGPLLPEGPDNLLAAYKQVAVTFQLHRDSGLLQRPPSNGLPSPSAGAFWTDLSAQEGVVQTLPPYAPTAPAAATGVDAQQQPGPYSSSGSDSGSSSSSQAGQQQVVQQQYMAPPLRVAAGAWQQPSQQLLARPVQQLPLLPHLAKPWVKQQTLRFRQQQEHAQQQQVMQQQQQVMQQQQQHQDAGGGQPIGGLQDGYEEYPGWRQSLSLSGKVLPPLPVLFQRALDIEEQLLKADVNG